MSHLHITHQGELYRDGDDRAPKLLVQRSDLEIMRQRMNAESVAWLVPAADRTMTEYYQVLSGRVILFTDPPQTLEPGDSFTLELLDGELRMAAEGDAELLCVTNRPAYDELTQFNQQVMALMDKVNEKDNYTRRHCQNVMRISVKLYQLLQDREGLTMDVLVPAAVFHDVGKINIPDEVLKKPDRYTPAEYQEMMRHPFESEKILRPCYGDEVARIAGHHHERMDGSGYPDGLMGDEIPLGARILAVADSFEAMTSGRAYTPVRNFDEALAELKRHPQAYDPAVMAALEELLRTGHPLYHAIM